MRCVGGAGTLTRILSRRRCGASSAAARATWRATAPTKSANARATCAASSATPATSAPTVRAWTALATSAQTFAHLANKQFCGIMSSRTTDRLVSCTPPLFKACEQTSAACCFAIGLNCCSRTVWMPKPKCTCSLKTVGEVH